MLIRLFVSLMLLAPVTLAAAASPHEVVRSATDDLLTTIEREREVYQENPRQFFAAVEEVLLPFIDFDTIARRVMAGHYQQASSEQRSRFADVFRSSLVNTYARGLVEYDNQKIVVLPESPGDRRGNRARVKMEIWSNAGARYPVTYSMYETREGSWMLENVTINGINIGLTFRNQFAHAMRQHDGDLDRVIDTWSSAIGGEDQKEAKEEQASTDAPATAAAQ